MPSGPSVRARAAALLAGETPPTEVAADEGAKLFSLFERRAVIEYLKTL